MNIMTFLKKIFHEICQKGFKKDLSMLPVALIIINAPTDQVRSPTNCLVAHKVAHAIAHFNLMVDDQVILK